MKTKLLLSVIGLFFFIISNASACDFTNIIKQAKKEVPALGKSDVYDKKSFATAYGRAYTIYYNEKPNASNAHMIMVTVNKSCEVLHVSSPSPSTFTLKSKNAKKAIKKASNQCVKNGTIMADNHEFSVMKCGNKYRFDAYVRDKSRLFTAKEIKKIKSIFKRAKRSKYYNKQTIYKTKGLRIWVRLYSQNKWFLVFDFDTPNTYGNINAWIPSTQFKEFINLLK